MLTTIPLWLKDVLSGQKPWWNWYLTPVVNFVEVRRAQLAKSTLLTSSLVPLGSFQTFKSLFRCQRESGARKATGSYRTYSSLVKLQPTFLSLQRRPAFEQNCRLGASVSSEGPALGQNTDDIYVCLCVCVCACVRVRLCVWILQNSIFIKFPCHIFIFCHYDFIFWENFLYKQISETRL